jgi:cell fate regulator YaaT (PSP1 superfamily)
MTDNPAGFAHQNGDQAAQENPQNNIASDPQTENPPVDEATPEDTPKDDVSEQKPSMEPSDSAGSNSNEDIPESTAKSPDRQKKKISTPQESKPPQPRKSVVVRYGLMRQIGEFRHNQPQYIPKGTKVVVRTERGVELGDVLINVKDNNSPHEEISTGIYVDGGKLDQFIKGCGSNYPFRRNGRVLRTANQQDIVDFRHLNGSANEEAKYARDQIKQRKLPMKLISVEHLLGGGRIVFHFTAESRVDFRDLVRDLASQFRTRIEMRQVGARDEARLVADYERCGQRCCCQEFLKDLKPISMRMAKVQKATLDPSKISGRCSRLMCCLKYEDASYEELRKKLPRRNTWVRTHEVTGKIVDTQIITQLVRLLLPDGTQTVVATEDIIEHDVEPGSEHPKTRPRPEKTPNGKCGRCEKPCDKSSLTPEDEIVGDSPAVEDQPQEDHEQVRARHIENAPELSILQDDAVTPMLRSSKSELVDAEDDSIPLSELFGLDTPVEHQQLDVKLKPEFRNDETIEPQTGGTSQESEDGDKEQKSSSDNAPKKKRRRRGRRRKKK